VYFPVVFDFFRIRRYQSKATICQDRLRHDLKWLGLNATRYTHLYSAIFVRASVVSKVDYFIAMLFLSGFPDTCKSGYSQY